jgi:hypothetical protein
MDNFEKIDLIVNGKLKEAKAKLEIARNREGDPYGSNPTYIQDLEQAVDTLSQIWCEIQAIKNNHPAVRDEMVLKMYKLKT